MYTNKRKKETVINHTTCIHKITYIHYMCKTHSDCDVFFNVCSFSDHVRVQNSSVLSQVVEEYCGRTFHICHGGKVTGQVPERSGMGNTRGTRTATVHGTGAWLSCPTPPIHSRGTSNAASGSYTWGPGPGSPVWRYVIGREVRESA